MNKEELQQKIAEYYGKLSPEAQRVFSGQEWLDTLGKISEKYKLNNEQTQTLATETMLALLGLIDLNEYEKTLAEEISIPKYSLDEMMVEIDDLILKDIRPYLMDAFEKNNQGPEEGENKQEEEYVVETKTNESITEAEEKNSIEKSKYKDTLFEIGKKYNLTVFQMGILGEAVKKILSGTMPSSEFEQSIKGINTPPETTKNIINDINEQILKKIREGLMGYNEEHKITKNIERKPEVTQKAVVKELDMNEKELPPGKLEDSNQITLQKLSGSFQIPKKETEHTIPNLTKNDLGEKKLPKVDPYREQVD